jgi:uncharacterized membrane protein
MRARVIVVGLAGAAYVGASHWLMTREPASGWSAVAVVGPMLALAGLYAWQRRQRLLAAIAALVTAGLVFQAWHGGGLSPGSIYVAQHVGIHVLLAMAFGMTLQRGHEPLITALARRVHLHFSEAMAAYSRKVTLAWTVYFLTMAAISIALYAFAPFDVWAAFANLATPLAMVVMFLGEYVLRYRLHPEFERATLSQAMHAYAHRAAPPIEPAAARPGRHE